MTRSFTKIMETAEAQDFWAASCGRLNVKECPHRDNIPQSLLLPVGICTHSFGDRHPQFRLTSVHHNLEYPENILNHRVDSSLVFLTIIVFVVILSTCADLMPLPLDRWLVRSRSTQVLVILLITLQAILMSPSCWS